MSKVKITFESRDGKETREEIILKRQLEFFQWLTSKEDSTEQIVKVEEIPSVFDKQLIQGTLDSGELVDLRKFSFHLTYGNLIEGYPDPADNMLILERLKSPPSHGQVKHHLRMPAEESIQNELPVFYGKATWVHFPEEGKPSELCVTWFFDRLDPQRPLHSLLQESLSGLDWHQHAEKYDASDL
ncbi:MAG: hypothetical protein ACQEW9_04905 [Bacteroidota bacterium]